MSSRIIVDNISLRNNPAMFQDNIEFDITFTALQPMEEQLEWRIIYVGSAKNQEYDQLLQEFQIGPILEESTMKFTVDCPPPDFRRIPPDQLVCVTAIILTISYRHQQFLRVGYYVHNTLTQELQEEERASEASMRELVKHVRRTILIEKPRMTRFRINWGSPASMKEETNKSPEQRGYNSNQSLLGNKMAPSANQEEKQSTQEEKEHSSRSIMRSEGNEMPELESPQRMEEPPLI